MRVTKTKSGNERTISSIETHFSDFVLTKSGEQMPDAYLINFNNDDGFAILGANTSITPIIAAVETGNTSWNKVLIPVNKMPVDGTDTDNDEEEEEDLSYMEALGPGLESDQILSLCVSSALYTKSGEERSGASSGSGTGATPDAVKNGMKKLGFINISKESRTHLTDSHIKTITEMLNKKNPVLICGWSLFELSKSHY